MRMEKIILIMFSIVFIVVFVLFYNAIFVRIPQVKAICEAKNMTMYDNNGRGYFCVDKEGRLYIVQ